MTLKDRRVKKSLFILFLTAFIILPSCQKERTAESQSADYQSDGLGLYRVYDEVEMESAAAPYAPMPTTEAALAESGDGGRGELAEKKIRTGNMSLETTDFDGAFAFIKERAETAGGYVEYSDMYLSGSGHRNASYTIRVPAEEYQRVMSEIAGLGGVLSQSTSEEDVTDQYYDITTRLSTKEAEEQRLLELIGQAGELSDLILLEERLSAVRADIEYYKTRQLGIDRKASFSTIYLNLAEVDSVYDPETLWSRVSRAFGDSLDGVAGFFQSAVVFIVSAFVPLLILTVIIFAGIFVFRKIMRGKTKPLTKDKSRNKGSNDNE